MNSDQSRRKNPPPPTANPRMANPRTANPHRKPTNSLGRTVEAPESSPPWEERWRGFSLPASAYFAYSEVSPSALVAVESPIFHSQLSIFHVCQFGTISPPAKRK